jgi:hypothetical protein
MSLVEKLFAIFHEEIERVANSKGTLQLAVDEGNPASREEPVTSDVVMRFNCHHLNAMYDS